MFDQIFRKTFTINKHLNAPLVEERIKYLEHWNKLGRTNSTLTSIAQYLLRIIKYLNLESNRVITLKEIEVAANLWGRYQSNHPAKRINFSESAKQKFAWYAIDWIKKLNRLEQLPEDRIALFNKIFTKRHARLRHINNPLLKERLQYIQYWADNGAVDSSLRRISQYLLTIMKLLNFKEIRIVSLLEIQKAAEKWASNEHGHWLRKNNISKFATARFMRDTLGWFKMLGCLKVEAKKSIPFEDYLNGYLEYMHEEQGLSENTIKSRIGILTNFLFSIDAYHKDFIDVIPLTIDEILTKKHEIDGHSRRTVQSYTSIIRSFVKYAENHKWCKQRLADSIKSPRVYRYEQLPYSPSWDEVTKIISNTRTNHPTDIRDYAILLLLSVYGLRCSEVRNLRLEDIDWTNELLYLRRAKRCKPQTFPLSKTVGEAILRYLQKVRPNNCLLREVFLCRKSPYRKLTSSAIYGVVSNKLKPLNLKIKHHGPHALRHACATHLINDGVSLKEISNHLGHRMLDTTRIYTKVDLNSLRKVSEIELGDLL
jgi:site-specific recombinase XerD